TWRLNELTVNYRTPAAVAEAAVRMATAAGLPISPLTSAREVDDALVVTRESAGDLLDAVADRAKQAVTDVTDDLGAGRVAVVAVGSAVPAVHEALVGAGLQPAVGQPTAAADLDAPLVLLTPREAKGLEFDAVVLVEPADVLAESAGDLYVAMTRPTKVLHVVHSAELPAGIAV
ncbi:MAG TPA: AAA family ATPase, partial [Cellulomonas sp.]|nr:AAA family ATPase [Cellulomonas sp.]